jgi:hypothetical protein
MKGVRLAKILIYSKELENWGKYCSPRKYLFVSHQEDSEGLAMQKYHFRGF